MPTQPTIQNFSATGFDVLNAIRNAAPPSYQERVPMATKENLATIGQTMLEYQTIANEFLSALVNRIGRVLITSKMYTNPLKEFKKGMLEYGETVEEIFVAIAKASVFDPAAAENDVFKREIPDVKAAFHTRNYRNKFKATITNEDLRAAFLSDRGITDLIAKIVDSLYTGSEYDEFTIMKELIAIAAKDGKFYTVNVGDISTETGAKSALKVIRGVSNKLTFMSNLYNPSRVLTHTPISEQVVLVDAAVDATFDVDSLAYAFNMNKVDFQQRKVLVDDFGSLTGVVAAVVDKDWFMVFDNLISFTEQYNGAGLYWNYWLHVWKTFSFSPFKNAVLFLSAYSAVTSITLDPTAKSFTPSKGGTQKFNATVTGTGIINKAVNWSTDSTEDGVEIAQDGTLTVAATVKTGFNVIATSVQTPTVTAQAAITFA